MRRITRWFWILVALVFLFEAWLWDHLEPLVAWVVDRLPLRRIKIALARWVSQLSPAFTLILFIVPMGLLLPFKLAGLWMLARGYLLSAATTLVLAKVVGLGLTAFIFDVTRPKLLKLAWFRWIYDLVLSWRDWAHALIDPIKRHIKARMWMFAPGRAGRTLRLLLRIRRRMHAPVPDVKLERPGAVGP
jgi:hypothetical protein